MDRKDIANSMDKFAKFNDINLNSYFSNPSPFDLHYDTYIGSDIFEDRIIEWLSCFPQDSDKEILLKLLENFRYYPQNKYDFELFNIFNEIRTKESDLSKVFFVTFPSKNHIASGGDSLRSSLVKITNNLLAKDHILSDAVLITDSALISEISQAHAIVFIDDIFGTGLTLARNVKNFLGKYNIHISAKIYIASLSAKKSIHKDNLMKWLRPQVVELIITEYTTPQIESAAYLTDDQKKRIEEIELYLEDNRNDPEKEKSPDKTYYLGFKQSQQLIGFFYNIPNNTLMNIWMPTAVSLPLFCRHDYKRPGIDDLKNKTMVNTEKAYLLGKVTSKTHD